MKQEAINIIRERCASIRDLLLVGTGSAEVDSVIRVSTGIIEDLTDELTSKNLQLALLQNHIDNLESQLDEADIHCRNLQAIVDDCNR
ncbi:hypothetical protein KAMAJI_00190 [Serratia phage vB_SmaM-Kamaji]|nr:hypothetical protein KAMAJI_00190 [Serratia phage vB_SmaM-Kamaji]